MAFFRRTTTLMRSALPRLRVQESARAHAPQHPLGEHLLKSFSPCSGARFMCSIPSTKLFVGGLAWGMDENSLRDSFGEFGEVVDAKVVVDRDSGRSKGFGFVSFTCTDHAQAAMDGMDGKLLNGRTLRVNFAIEKQRGFGTFGAYGGGDSGSSFGSSSFSTGQGSGDATNQENDNFLSNNSFNQETLDSVGGNKKNEDYASQDDFFGDDAFVNDPFDKDNEFSQSYK